MSQSVCEFLSAAMVVLAAVSALSGIYSAAILALVSAVAFLWVYVKLGERR